VNKTREQYIEDVGIMLDLLTTVAQEHNVDVRLLLLDLRGMLSDLEESREE
jgi:hypothetical protein